MTRLTVYAAASPSTVHEDTAERDRIEAALAGIGVRLERWVAVKPLDPGAGEREVLDAYSQEIARLRADFGYSSADVVRMRPDQPDIPAIRGRFLNEHTHAEDEVRFFAEGRGAFYLREPDHVYRVICERDDLLSVPARRRHWFDMGPRPMFTAIRLFSNPEGWIADFTDDDIARRVPEIDG